MTSAMRTLTQLETPWPGITPHSGTTPHYETANVPDNGRPCKARADTPLKSETMSLRVRQLGYEADGVISVLFVDPTGGTLPEWTPGAHLELVLPSGLIRQYSLCGDPRDRTGYRVAVLRVEGGRGGSVELHDTVRVGSILEVRGPRNHFEFVDANDYVLIAGGIGVTPIMSMVRHLNGRRPWRLFYGGRSRRSMAFLGELEKLAGEGTVEVTPQDESGLLDLNGIFAHVKEESVIYCCGPEPLLTAVQERSIQLGMAARLHVERFSPSPAAQTAVADSAALGDGFDVELARTGSTVRVEPGITVLDALRSVLPELPSSCEAGICGTCEVRVLGGAPAHHDLLLSDSEREAGESMLVCVSRSRTPKLILDL